MSEHIDSDTGEIRTNGIAARASAHAAQAHVATFAMRNGAGASSLHFAIWQAVQQMPVWITTDKSGAHKIKYATLKAILEVVRPVLMQHGVRIRQGADRTFGADEGGGVKGRLVPVYTDLIHAPTGEFERTQIEIPITRLDPQSMGSAITYGRRYTLLAALGLTSDEADDDGARAMPVDLSAKRSDSDELVALKSDIDGCKDVAALTKWVMDPKNRKRIDQLGEVDADRLREHYSSKREQLSSAK
jgi:hypothetical protein